MPLILRPLISLQINVKEPEVVGLGPFGLRRITIVTGGEVTGERLSGSLRAGGGDWLLAGPDGFWRLDVRATIETDDGALIYLTYFAILELSERAMQAMTHGLATDYGEVKLIAQPRFETGDQRYGWLNSAVCVAEGRLLSGSTAEYRVYEVLVTP